MIQPLKHKNFILVVVMVVVVGALVYWMSGLFKPDPIKEEIKKTEKKLDELEKQEDQLVAEREKVTTVIDGLEQQKIKNHRHEKIKFDNLRSRGVLDAELYFARRYSQDSTRNRQ